MNIRTRDIAALLALAAPIALAQEPAAEPSEPTEQSQSAPEAAVDMEAAEARLFEEFARYRRLVNEGTLDEADVVAKRIVEMAIRIYGPRSRETASALNNLAIVQHSNGQYEAAIQNFTSAVEITEVVEDRLNSALVNPLKGLGAAQLAHGRPDRANRTFNRAAHITRVNEGPHNIEQVEILESIAETQLRLGDLKEARKVLDRIHVLNVRFFEKDPMGLIPSLMNRARWQHRAGYYNEERASYRRAIRIVEAGGDKNNPLLIEPLRRLGESFYFVDVSMSTPQQQGIVSTGEIYFKRAARIAERAEGVDWREIAKAKLALADYYTYTEAQNRARKIYREMWNFLSTDDERTEHRSALFDEPVPMRTDALPTFAGAAGARARSQDDLRNGKITVTYTVNARGRVRNLRTEASPVEFSDMQKMVHREIRRRVFRPRIVEGEVVDAPDLVFEHSFSYLQADLDTIRAQQEAEAAANEDRK